MMIKKVVLENFLSHKSTSVDFYSGVNVLVGPNGAGKTSILDAISFGLFGETKRVARNEELINNTASKATVQVVFSRGGKDYLVERTLYRKRKTSDAVLYLLEGEDKRRLVARNVNTVNTEVKRILGLDGSLFYQSIYIRQGEIDSLVTENRAEREKIFAQLLGIKDLENAYEKMGEIINKDYREKRSGLEGELSRKPTVEREIKSVEAEIKKLESELAQEEKAAEPLKEELSKLEAKLKELDEKANRHQDLAQKQAGLYASIQELRRSLDARERELREAEEAARRADEVREEMIELLRQRFGGDVESPDALDNALREKRDLLKKKNQEKKEFEGAHRELEVLDKNIRKREGELGRKRAELLETLDKYSQILGEKVDPSNIEGVLERKREELRVQCDESRINKLRCDIQVVESRIRELEDGLSKMSSLNVCPLCKRELTADHRAGLQAEIGSELKKLTDEKTRLEGELKSAEVEIEGCDQKLAEVSGIDPSLVKKLTDEVGELEQGLEQERAELSRARARADELRKIEGEVSALEAEIEDLEELKRRVDKLREQYNRYVALAEKLDSLRNEVNNIRSDLYVKQKELDEVAHKISDLGYDPGQHKSVKTDFEQKTRELQDIQKRIVGLQVAINEKRNLKAKYEEELKELYVKEREKERLEGFIGLLEKIRGAFSKDGVQRLVRASARGAIEAATNEILGGFNLSVTDVRLDDNFDIHVTGTFGSQSIDQLSGGERIAVAIAMRLAISRVLAGKVETVIMDEPTVFLDDERRRTLIDVLKNSAGFVPQMIVVTHDSELKGAANASLYNVERGADGFSHVS